jgi:hypothetical protein
MLLVQVLALAVSWGGNAHATNEKKVTHHAVPCRVVLS